MQKTFARALSSANVALTLVLTLGMSSSRADVGGAKSEISIALTIHGSPGTDAQATIDGMHFNLFNANTVLAATATYGPNWLRPSGVLGPRLFKTGVQVDF